MKRIQPILAAACLAIALSLPGRATAQAVKVNLDTKVIHVDSLNMPANTSAYAILAMMPELLQRPGAVSYSNYDITVNGMSVSDVSDVALNQIHLEDIKTIEISESPISSYQKNGVGGSIDIILKDHGTTGGDMWGSVGMEASYPLDIAPQLMIGHSSPRFIVRGVLLSELYNNSSSTESRTYDGDRFTGAQWNDIDERYRAQLARVYMKFRPTANDEFKLNLSQIYRYNKQVNTPGHDALMVGTEKGRASKYEALLNYKRTMGRSSLTLEAQYTYNPGYTHNFYPDVQDYKNRAKSNNVSGKVEFKSTLWSGASGNNLKMGAGCKMNGAFKHEDITSQNLLYMSDPLRYEPENNTFFAQPFAYLETTVGKVRLKVIGEFQHFSWDISKMDETYDTESNDFTGKFIAEWHLTPHRDLRLMADRKLQRPNNEQLFPHRLYSAERQLYVEGNPYLTPVMSHEIRLDYVSDYRWDEHSLLFEAGASYNHVDDIINSVLVGGNAQGGMGLTQKYITFENNATNRIVSANLMAMYAFRSFSLSFTGNVYNNNQHIDGDYNHYTYYNLSVNPHFNLKDGWHGSVSITYNSKVKRVNSSLSDYTMSTMSVGKRWDDFFIYCFNKIALQKQAMDVQTDTSVRKERFYEMAPNVVGVGVKYNF